MLTWLSYFRMEIYRMAVEGMPSSSDYKRIFLRAKTSPVYLSMCGGWYLVLCRRLRRCLSRVCPFFRTFRPC